MYKVSLINDGKETVIHYPNFSNIKMLSGQIKIGENVASDFVFNISVNNPGYNKIQPFKTLVKVLNTKTNKLEFEGRVSSPYEEMAQDGIVFNTFDCESELAYLNDSSQRHAEFHDITVRQFLIEVIKNHNKDVANSDIDKTFEVGIVDVDSSTSTVYRYLGYESTWATIKDKLIDRLGGEIQIRKVDGVRYIDYINKIGEVKQTEIRLAKNLKSISRDVDPTQIITRLVPLGNRVESDNEWDTDASQSRLTIKTVNNDKDYIEDPISLSLFGPITKSVSWDDITQPSILKTRGQQYLNENNRVKIKYQLTALDLSLIDLDVDNFDVYNWYPVINPLMDINEELRVIGKTINVLDPQNSTLEIGDKFMTASEYQYKTNKGQRKIVELESTVESQTKKLSNIQTELNNVDEVLDRLNEAIGDGDIPALENAVGDLNEAVSDLMDVVESIPNYGPAKEDEDGLMSATDKKKINLIDVISNVDLDELKNKLDLIEVINAVNLDDLKGKLDLITVTNSIDLDKLYDDVENLKNG